MEAKIFWMMWALFLYSNITSVVTSQFSEAVLKKNIVLKTRGLTNIASDTLWKDSQFDLNILLKKTDTLYSHSLSPLLRLNLYKSKQEILQKPTLFYSVALFSQPLLATYLI